MSATNNTLNAKMAELDTLVSWFDGDDCEIEEAIGKFKEAEKLASDIEKDLSALKNEITVLKKKFDEVA